MAVTSVGKENPFLEIKDKYNGVWTFARSLFERKYGDHRNWPITPQPIDVDGYQASVVPMYNRLHLKRESSSALATLEFNSLDGSLANIIAQEGLVTTTFGLSRMERVYGGDEESIETIFSIVPNNIDELVDVWEMQARSGNAWTHYKRRGARSFPIPGGLAKGYLYHEGPTDTPGYQRLAQLPDMLKDGEPIPALLGYDVTRRINFSDEIKAALEKTGLEDFPIGGPF